MTEEDLNYDNNDFMEEEVEDTQKNRFITFAISDEEYGIEIKNVIEIIGIYKITPIPETESFVRGVINLRGKVIPVIDVRLRFGMEFREYDARTCTIVVNIDGLLIGFIVDTIDEVLEILEENIDPASGFSQGKKGKFVVGMGKVNDKVIILLDVEKLLSEEILEKLKQ